MRDDADARPSGPVLSARSWERDVTVAFDDYRAIDADLGEFLVRVEADRLTAVCPVLMWHNGDGIAAYLTTLTDNFRGWEGVLAWRSLESQLRIDAEWQTGGHVSLTFAMTPSVYDLWTVQATVTLEAGEELARFTQDLAAFLEI